MWFRGFVLIILNPVLRVFAISAINLCKSETVHRIFRRIANFHDTSSIKNLSLISRSAHRTPNFMNPEYFVCLLFKHFFPIQTSKTWLELHCIGVSKCPYLRNKHYSYTYYSTDRYTLYTCISMQQRCRFSISNPGGQAVIWWA